MELSEKVRHLREVEGVLRGLGRPMTKAEVVRAMRDELGRSISDAYLSQIGGGAGPPAGGHGGVAARFLQGPPGLPRRRPAGGGGVAPAAAARPGRPPQGMAPDAGRAAPRRAGAGPPALEALAPAGPETVSL